MEIQNEHRLTELEARSKSNSRRLDKVEQRQDALEAVVAAVQSLATREARVEADVQEIKSDVKSLKAKPAKRWEALGDKALWAVVAAVLGFLLARLGL